MTPDSTAPIDVRAGMTSASNARADSLCPGRHFAQRGVPLPAESRDARAGTLIHKAFAGEEVDLSAGQRKTLKRGRFLEYEIVRRYFKEPLLDEEILKMAHRNQRYWAHIAQVPVHSGELDAVWISRDWKSALIEDLKGLFGDVEDATENMQLRDYAAIFYENFPEVESVSVFINQPGVRWKLEDQLVVTYDLAALKEAHRHMLARVVASNDVKAERVPGLDQCKFCRAAGTARCPESQRLMLDVPTKGRDVTLDDPAKRGAWVEELKTVEKTVDKLLASVKEELKRDPAWATGWKVGEGDTMREIKDAAAAMARAEEFLGEKFDRVNFAANVCKVSVPKLQEWLTEALGDDVEPKAAFDTFTLIFGGLIKTKQKEGSLTKAKAS